LKLDQCGSTGESCPAVLARTLLESDYGSGLAAVKRLAESGERVTAERILNHLDSFWVRPLAAKWIPQIAQNEPTKRAVALNGSPGLEQFTARMYVKRACADTGEWPIATPVLIGQEHDSAWIAEQILTEFANKLVPKMLLQNLDPKEVVRQIRERDKLSPQIVLLPSGVPTPILDALRSDDRFSTVTFISYFDHVPDTTELQAKNLRLIEPALSPEEDRNNMQLWIGAHQATQGLT
jgi:hypothetical protein